MWKYRDGLLADVVLSVVEAIVVLFIAHLYLVVLGITYGLSTPGLALVDAVTAAAGGLRSTEVFTYATGILSSTTGYFLVRLGALKRHALRITTILLCTMGLIWLATPLFIAGLDGEPKNRELASNLALILGLATLLLWLYSLFCKRRIFEHSHSNIGGEERGEQIAKNLENRK